MSVAKSSTYPRWRELLIDAITFTRLQFFSAAFGIGVFATLALTKFVSPLPRYDFVLLLCIVVQWVMIRTKMESMAELKMITLFHVLGLALEVWKVQHGSWSYADDGYIRIAGVPLYSGFMYASVASYITQAWKRFNLQMKPLPPPWLAIALASAAYLNFFANAFLADLRWWLIGAVMLTYARTRCSFTLNDRRYWLPLSAAFVLIAIFIYVGENLGTQMGAWQYPNQKIAWSIVHQSKISSWFLLIIVSYIIVAALKTRLVVGRK